MHTVSVRYTDIVHEVIHSNVSKVFQRSRRRQFFLSLNAVTIHECKVVRVVLRLRGANYPVELISYVPNVSCTSCTNPSQGLIVVRTEK